MFGPQRCVGSRLCVTGNNSKRRFILRDTVTLKSNNQKKTPLAVCERRTASARQQSATQRQGDSTTLAAHPVRILGTSGVERSPSTERLPSVLCQKIVYSATDFKKMS